jgi:hypothetical protein
VHLGQPHPAHAGGTEPVAPALQGQVGDERQRGDLRRFADPLESGKIGRGDPLTFSVTNKPGWLSFSTSTGKLSGTPSSAHVGLHKDIRISVSDGQATVSLEPFSLTVSEPQPSTGSATASWAPPTERTDGTAIDGISGYKIYYGKSPTQLDQAVNLGSGLTSYMIDNLDSGTWYFAVTATCSTGLESEKSSIASKSIS